ncbi:hypothetical protein [Enemella sp. A6]|uniref:hypothetical protein n=1 Tax=Enemella sp. A6 TaxID=3440152 RepID=UPI003EBE60FA
MTASLTPDLRAEIADLADRIRVRVLEHVIANNGGYMSQACSAAELLAVMYRGGARLEMPEAPVQPGEFTGVPGPNTPRMDGAAVHGPRGGDLDYFIVSPAHYALVIYTALIESGRLDPGALDNFNRDGSTVEMIGAEHSPGFELTTGSLSQALSVAGGLALGRRLKGESGRIWVFMSDGEFQEGQTWEAFQALAFHGLDSVRVIVDVNAAQCDGPMEQVMTIEPLADRLQAFGASVDRVDGHDIDAIWNAVHRDTGKPHVVLCDTDPARGLDELNSRRPVLHYLRFTGAEERERYIAAHKKMVNR